MGAIGAFGPVSPVAMERLRFMSRPRIALALGLATLLVSPASASAPALAHSDLDVAPGVASVAVVAAAPETVVLPQVEVAQPIAVEEDEAEVIGTGTASYYGAKFQGRRTASGERFDMNELTAAHRTLPFGTRVRVTNEANGKSVVVRINDRGPFSGHRILDLSRAAASEIGLVARGHGQVELARLD